MHFLPNHRNRVWLEKGDRHRNANFSMDHNWHEISLAFYCFLLLFFSSNKYAELFFYACSIFAFLHINHSIHSLSFVLSFFSNNTIQIYLFLSDKLHAEPVYFLFHFWILTIIFLDFIINLKVNNQLEYTSIVINNNERQIIYASTLK